jgi:hypothetical protein
MMTVLTRCLLCKGDLAGWEVMELFAGGVNQSDKFFNEFASTIGDLLRDDDAPGTCTRSPMGRKVSARRLT